MNKTAVIFADGCEEGEALTIVDIFRRAEMPCDMVGLDKTNIMGAHDVLVHCDRVLAEDMSEYDMVVLPGGYGAAVNMGNSDVLLNVLRTFMSLDKYVGAICAAPTVLEKAGVLEGKRFTCYPTKAAEIKHGTHCDDVVVVDGKLITSQGPATAWAFAYRLVDEVGGNSEPVKQRMVYYNAFDVKGAE